MVYKTILSCDNCDNAIDTNEQENNFIRLRAERDIKTYDGEKISVKSIKLYFDFCSNKCLCEYVKEGYVWLE